MKNLKGRRFIRIFLALLSFIVAILVSIISSLLFFNKNNIIPVNNIIIIEITINIIICF